MCNVKSWVIDKKKPIPLYPDWNDKKIEVQKKTLVSDFKINGLFG